MPWESYEQALRHVRAQEERTPSAPAPTETPYMKSAARAQSVADTAFSIAVVRAEEALRPEGNRDFVRSVCFPLRSGREPCDRIDAALPRPPVLPRRREAAYAGHGAPTSSFATPTCAASRVTLRPAVPAVPINFHPRSPDPVAGSS